MFVILAGLKVIVTVNNGADTVNVNTVVTEFTVRLEDERLSMLVSENTITSLYVVEGFKLNKVAIVNCKFPKLFKLNELVYILE